MFRHKGKTMRVAAIGDNCMDVYTRLGRQYPTGNVVDFAVNMQQLGIPTSVISVTGSDEYGQLMMQTLKDEGVDISHLHVGEGPTAITYMDLNGKDRVHGDYVEGVLSNLVFSPEDIEFASRHDLVHTAFWGKADQNLEQLRANGAIISFDYATKYDDPMVQRTLPLVDYAFFSFSRQAAPDFLKKAWQMGPKVVVATFGSEGSLAYDGKDFHSFGIYPAIVENTVGAGDAFIAGFMYSILNGSDILRALDSGARIAASVVETFEPWVKTKS
jgi:fructoselysine 6-kinase